MVLVIVQNSDSRAALLCMRILLAPADTLHVLFQFVLTVILYQHLFGVVTSLVLQHCQVIYHSLVLKKLAHIKLIHRYPLILIDETMHAVWLGALCTFFNV